MLLIFKYHVFGSRETHIQYRYFNRQPNRNKQKRETEKPC